MCIRDSVSVDTLVEEPLDTPLGFGTGAGVIFGACLLYTSRCV